VCLQLDTDSGRQRKRSRLARRPVVAIREKFEPARIDDRPVFLRVDEIGNQTDVVGAESGALDQRSKILPGVEKLLRGILRQSARLAVYSADSGGKEQVAHPDQVGGDRALS